MSNQARCSRYTAKKVKRKAEDLMIIYNNYNSYNLSCIEEVEKESQYQYELLPNVCSKSIASQEEQHLNNYVNKFLKFKKIKHEELSNEKESVLDFKLKQWISSSSNDEEALSDIKKWIVDNSIPHNQADKLLKIIQTRWMTSIPKTTRSLLNCNTKLKIQSMKAASGSTGEFVYFGIEKKLKKIVNVELHYNRIDIMIFIDGLSPFKSSSTTIWPILAKVYSKQGYYKPFTVAVYAGDSKPEDATDYFQEFIYECNKLSMSKICIDNRQFDVRIKCFICDTPARSFAKCTAGHTAFAACERCTTTGKKSNKVTVFTDSNAPEITNRSFRSFENPDHHKGISPLIYLEPHIDIVKQFMLDPMHLLYLGVMKRALEFLLQSGSHHIVRLSATQKTELERRTKLICKDIPQEFPRKMRSSDNYGKYKAVEYKFMAQYAAPIVFKDLVSNEVYDHLMLLTCACRLMSYQNPLPYVQAAKIYLKTFVDNAVTIYGETFMSLNVHNLIHLCDDVITTKCNFNELSAFPFESHLGYISRSLRSPTHILAQYCQRDLEKETHATTAPTSGQEIKILMRQAGMIVKLQYKDIVLSISPPDNAAILDNGCCVEISKFENSENQILVSVNKFMRKESIFHSPCESSFLNFWQFSGMSPRTIRVPLKKIQQKCIRFSMNLSTTEDQKIFFVSLLHLDPSES